MKHGITTQYKILNKTCFTLLGMDPRALHMLRKYLALSYTLSLQNLFLNPNEKQKF